MRVLKLWTNRVRAFLYAWSVDLLLYCLLAMLMLFYYVADVQAGENCDEYKNGFADGYCAEKATYTCIPPLPPYCLDGRFDNPRQAYQAGIADGQKRAAS